MWTRRAALGVAGVAGVAGVLAISGCGYNTIQQLDEQASQAQHNIEVQLQRRSDLIGNLVETVKGQAKQELAVFTDVTRARAGLDSAIQSHDPSKMADANLQLSSQVTILQQVRDRGLSAAQIRSGFLAIAGRADGN